MIKQPRVLKTQTSLENDAPVLIAAPNSLHGRKAANRIHLALQNLSVRSEIREDPEDESMRSADGPVVVVGNLADSRCIK
ncbi:MAG: hypothetical protein DRP71_07390, partial [Verrucomicrobia bacterium]